MEKKLTEVRKTKFKTKLKLNNYLKDDQNDDPFGYLSLEKFYTSNFTYISPTFDDYLNGNISLRRKIIVGFVCLLQ
jgi:hypothetical protein